VLSVLSILRCTWFDRTKMLLAPMIAHGIYNGMVLALQLRM
jgi:hypothetical protein